MSHRNEVQQQPSNLLEDDPHEPRMLYLNPTLRALAEAFPDSEQEQGPDLDEGPASFDGE